MPHHPMGHFLIQTDDYKSLKVISDNFISSAYNNGEVINHGKRQSNRPEGRTKAKIRRRTDYGKRRAGWREQER